MTEQFQAHLLNDFQEAVVGGAIAFYIMGPHFYQKDICNASAKTDVVC
jgi:hypothetical protein